MKVMQSITPVLVFLLFSGSLLGHTGLRSSIPANGATLTEAPKQLVLEFRKEVVLIKVTIKDKQDRSIKIDFKPSAAAAKTFDIPLPTLAPASYTTKWVAMGKDAHKMTGSFSFILHEANSMEEVIQP